ncbi:MAG: AraC family transcriptional regulator [Clostridia bacterium]|nr:AraC family transcriptional regulator [Clostridia bacterium]
MFFDVDKPIKVSGFGRISQSAGHWHADWKRHNFLLLYLSQGDLVMWVGDHEVPMKAGDVLIVPPNTPYRPLQSNGCTYYHFYFFASPCEKAESNFSIDRSYCKGLPNFSFSYSFTEHTVIELQELTHNTEDSRLSKIINRCAELDLWHHPEEKMLLDNYLREILIQLSFLREKSSDKGQSFMRMALFIQSNYTKNITLKEVSEAAHLSPSYAAKLFRKNSGMRCCDYINNVRLSAACEILINTPTPISKIAEMVGYNSQYYFARQFKKTYSITAMQFRKKCF